MRLSWGTPAPSFGGEPKITRVPKWCTYTTWLEPIFKDNPTREGIPTPFPAQGKGAQSVCVNVYAVLAVVGPVWFTPDFGRFCRSRGYGLPRPQAALAQNLPRRSRDRRVHPRNES